MKMKNTIRIISTISTLLVLGLPSIAFSEPVAVIVNSGNTDNVDAATVKAIYSDIKSVWANGNTIMLLELPVTATAREGFAGAVLKKSASDAQADWSNRQMNNTIKNQPKVKRDKLVVKLVGKKVDAIGYVPASMAEGAEGVKVIMTIP